LEPIESPVGIGQGDLLTTVADRMRRWIAAVDDVAALDGYSAETATMTGTLTGHGVDAITACQTLSGVHDTLIVRLIDLSRAELGPPPCAFVWLALGSAGRMEQSLYTDQDHAILYAEEDEAAARYFAALGAAVVDGLARAGLRRCPGGYMADRWHLPRAAWRERFRGWVERPEPQALVEAEVFLDFRPVCGDLQLDPLVAVLRRGSTQPRFLVGMARAAVRFPPPLRLMSPIPLPHGVVDLKREGLAAVVLLARMYALAAGSAARSTLDRLAAAAGTRGLSDAGVAELADGYRFLAELRLAAQLRQVAAGRPPTNLVPLAELTVDQRRHLRHALRAVRDVQRVTAVRFRTDTVL
jgi:CBS domain-containing protein